MNRSRPRLADCPGHILEAIERIRRYTGSLDEASFMRSERVDPA